MKEKREIWERNKGDAGMRVMKKGDKSKGCWVRVKRRQNIKQDLHLDLSGRQLKHRAKHK